MEKARRLPRPAPDSIKPGTELPKIGGGTFVVLRRRPDHYEVVDKTSMTRMLRLKAWWWRLWQ